MTYKVNKTSGAIVEEIDIGAVIDHQQGISGCQITSEVNFFGYSGSQGICALVTNSMSMVISFDFEAKKVLWSFPLGSLSST